LKKFAMPDLDQIKQGEQGEQGARDRRGRFVNGQSGDAAGRPRGCRESKIAVELSRERSVRSSGNRRIFEAI
jgi:hypothetical protein